MAIINLKDLRAALPRHARLIGLDPGSKTIENLTRLNLPAGVDIEIKL